MQPRYLVLGQYPQARTARRGVVYAYGRRGPYLQERWVTRAGPGPDARALGQGTSEEAAWLNAADHLMEGAVRTAAPSPMGRAMMLAVPVLPI